MTASIAWKLNRVRCMSAAEIAHRIAKAATLQIERLGLKRLEVPAPDLSFAPHPWIDAGAHVEPGRYVEAADRFAAGVFDVFALEGIELGTPPPR